MAECCTTSIIYDPPQADPPDAPGQDSPWPLIIPLIIFIAAVIWLASLAPKKEKKKVSEQITTIFNQASTDADAFTRPEVQRPLTRVREKVLEVLKAEGIE